MWSHLFNNKNRKLIHMSLPGFNLVQVIVSVLKFILGFAAAWLLARKDEKPAA